MDGARCWGLDVGSSAVHGVCLDEEMRVADAVYLDHDDDALLDRLGGAAVVSIDSPDRWSQGLHRSEGAAGKLSQARCGEVMLRRRFGYTVRFATPLAGQPLAWGWMRAGIGLFDRLRAALPGTKVVEVWPHAGFLHLAGVRSLPAKHSREGIQLRVGYLRQVLSDREDAMLELWSIHALEALMAAVVARDVAAGVAIGEPCPDHGSVDDSVLYLPRPLSARR